MLSSTPCPYVVSFYDAFVEPSDGTISFVMEYMDGGSLEDIIDTGGCSSESALANISWRILSGLAFIHEKRQIHRDIKPSNLLINHTGDVKISDFGLIREMDSTSDMAQTFVGTLTYMSPERIAGDPYTYCSDVWSFGLSILSVALGRFPMDVSGGYWTLLNKLRDEEPPGLPDDGSFSAEFRDFIRLTLMKDPAERPSATTLLEHPFVRHCAPTPEEEAAARVPEPPTGEVILGTLSDLKEIAKKVQQYRYKAAAKRHDRKLPRIPLPRFESLSYQMGVPIDVVRKEFTKRQRQANDQLKELHRRRLARGKSAGGAATPGGGSGGGTARSASARGDGSRAPLSGAPRPLTVSPAPSSVTASTPTPLGAAGTTGAAATPGSGERPSRHRHRHSHRRRHRDSSHSSTPHHHGAPKSPSDGVAVVADAPTS